MCIVPSIIHTPKRLLEVFGLGQTQMKVFHICSAAAQYLTARHTLLPYPRLAPSPLPIFNGEPAAGDRSDCIQSHAQALSPQLFSLHRTEESLRKISCQTQNKPTLSMFVQKQCHELARFMGQ